MTSPPWRRGGGAFTGWWWAWAGRGGGGGECQRFAARLQEAVDHANAEHRLADLCREMPQRLDALVKVYEADRLPR